MEQPIVYVTGVAGFLGSNVAADLLSRGYTVRGCDDLSVGVEGNVPDGVEFSHANCVGLPIEVFHGVQKVVHCAAIARSAWPDPQELWRSNVAGTLKVMTMARAAGVGRIVHASSSVVHFPNSSIYAQTKTVAERIALSEGALCLRFSNIYGRGQNELGHEPNVIAQMRRNAMEQGFVRVDGDGSQKRDFLHVSDAVQAVSSALWQPVSGIWIDICTGVQTSILNVATQFGVPIRRGPSREDPWIILQDPEPAHWVLQWCPLKKLEDGMKEVLS